MPNHRLGTGPAGGALVSQFQRHAPGGPGSSSPPGVLLVENVTVQTTEWLDDDGSGSTVTPTYTDAPRLGTIKYVDVDHGLGSETAFAVGYIDTVTGRWFSEFVDQIKIDDRTTRVWLPGTPANEISIKVIT